MGDVKHTSEPWSAAKTTPKGYRAGTFYECRIQYGTTKPGNTIAVVHMGGDGALYSAEDGVQANADRIVSCVNACAGINPEAVPEMVEALRELESSMVEPDTGEIHYACESLVAEWVMKIRAALAKATGEEGE